MPAEIQWRLRKPEWKVESDAIWKHHSSAAPGAGEILVKLWNLNDKFFEYRVIPSVPEQK